MPLSMPAPRAPIHHRSIRLDGWRRTDGLWDIEGVLTDTKAKPIEGKVRGTIAPGEPIHLMEVRLTLDDLFVVRGIEVCMDFTPYPQACPSIVPDFSVLVGLSVQKGFVKEVRARFGGTQGCMHLVELLGAMASTAFQTMYPEMAAERGDWDQRPPMLDTCHALAADGELVANLWPAHSTKPHPSNT